MLRFELLAPNNLTEILHGADLAQVIVDACQEEGVPLQTGDIVVIAQKIVSKAEGRFVDLNTVVPGEEALKLAGQSQKDPRLVELILRESKAILRVRPGLIVPETKHGLISANAGIDASNTGGAPNTVLLLPLDPDRSAEDIRRRILTSTGTQVGVIINDSQGRPFRNGAIGVAIGSAGNVTTKIYIGQEDRDKHTLQSSVEAVADEIASAASLLMGQGAEGRPVVIVRGLSSLSGEGKAADLVRDPSIDMFR
ncbi:MAG: coenzyme F420-0:L-glutamate ligase [Desulfitobacteriaceae bacterium]